MRRVLVVTNDTYATNGSAEIAGGDEMTDLAAGALAIFNPDGTLVDKTTPVFNDEKFYMAIGFTGGIVKPTTFITNSTVSYYKQAYVAPVKKKSFIGNDGATGAINFPSPLVAGTEAKVWVVDKEARHEQTNEIRRYYTHIVTATDTATTIVDGLVAQINADSKSVVTATKIGAGAGIQLEGNTAGHDFEMYVNGEDNILINADIIEGGTSNSVKVVKGEGTAAQIVPEELASDVRQGKQNSFLYNNELWSYPSNWTAAGTYVTYTLKYKNPKNEALQMKDEAYIQEVMIVVDSTKTGIIANIDTILAAL